MSKQTVQHLVTILILIISVGGPTLPQLHAEDSSPTMGFFGAARCYGGSCHVLNTGTQKIMLDCGSFMEKNLTQHNKGFPFPANSIDLVLLSHAHIDHCGRLPALYHSGYSGRVLCVEPTGKLTHIMLNVQKSIHHGESSTYNYSKTDVATAVSSITELNYNMPYTITDNTGFTFLPAEHILGSAMINVEFGQENQRKKLLFTGDFGNNINGILKQKATVTDADYLIVESTYGGKVHQDGARELAAFYNMLRDTAYDNGIVIIPSFVLARTQKVLGQIYHGIERGNVPDFLNVYVDSPSASRITRIYANNLDHLQKPFQGSPMGIWSPFSFRSLFLYRSFSRIQRPAVIIAPSADASVGKVVTHLKNYISKPDTRICFVSSFHPAGSLSEKIYAGADVIEIEGKNYPMRAKVFQFGSFSGHGDQAQLMEWLKNFSDVKRVFIVHGDLKNMQILSDKIQKTFNWNVTIPELNKTYNLETGISVD